MGTPIGTHYDGCWQDHLECAAAKVVQLEQENATLQGRARVVEAENKRLAEMLSRWFGLMSRQSMPTLKMIFHEMQAEVRRKKV